MESEASDLGRFGGGTWGRLIILSKVLGEGGTCVKSRPSASLVGLWLSLLSLELLTLLSGFRWGTGELMTSTMAICFLSILYICVTSTDPLDWLLWSPRKLPAFLNIWSSSTFSDCSEGKLDGPRKDGGRIKDAGLSGTVGFSALSRIRTVSSPSLLAIVRGNATGFIGRADLSGFSGFSGFSVTVLRNFVLKL